MMQTPGTKVQPELQKELQSGLKTADNLAPLRVAILLPDAAGFSSLTLKQLAPVRLNFQAFATTLNLALSHIAQDQAVIITSSSRELLLMPALMAARLKLHPHGHLGAMQLAENAERAAHLVQQQAKRGSLSQRNTSLTIEKEEAAFDALYRAVELLAKRSVCHGNNRQHYWFSAPHQARISNLLLHFPQAPSEKQHLALQLSQGTGRLEGESLLNENRLLFLLTANSQDEIRQALDELDKQLDGLDKIHSKARLDVTLLELMLVNLTEFDRVQTQTQAGQTRYRLALQAANLTQLKSELAAISSALEKVFTTLNPYKTPAGSYFSAAPLGKESLAFLYPGVGTVYPDMLCELHRYFPALFDWLEKQGDLRAMLQADSIYQGDKAITANMPLSALAIAGVGASYLLSKLMTQVFEVQPQFALGYSMGEAAMWASLDVWQRPHQLIEQTQTHELFTSAISGKLTAVRRAWGLDDEQELTWNSFVVRAAPNEIEALLSEYPRVYLAIIQGDSCVIAGCEASCQKLLQQLGKRGIAANRVTAMHTLPALSQHSEVEAFYRQAIHSQAINSQAIHGQSMAHKIRFISAANSRKGIDAALNQDNALNQERPLSSALIACALADTFCYPLDFTALIKSAVKQGARLFVEVGADRQNCTLIDKILQDNVPSSVCHSAVCHSAVPLNAKGASDSSMLLKALAQLLSHGVPVNLKVLQQGLERHIAQPHFRQPLAPSETDNRFKEEA
ncbi:PfaB family protein [Shewanella sp. AS1]|uniref:PfaB family protein n=1 Tax=Shewanella sp. AS1 TaxID=2907626 RepID=UPI001F218C2B|nr:PfaB family protein [Shewanella sp. AS1]MCE9678137.1 PfaB family protein [Shewanella sp. AS1]